MVKISKHHPIKKCKFDPRMFCIIQFYKRFGKYYLIIHRFAGYKTLQWWCRQSILGNTPNNDDMPSGQESSSKNSNAFPYVLGVPPQPKIICGLRNASSGLVSSLKEYSMEKLLSKNKETWKPNVCMNFLNHLLSFIKTSIVEENKVYRFYYNADPTKICVDDSHSKDINFVVPDWYLNYFKANSK